jgi:two-component system sensor histidine kinase DegS
LDEAVQSLNGVIGDLRNYILDLRPQQFQGRDIVQGIEELGRALRANTFISVDLDIDDVRPALFNPEQTVEVLHIFSEALSNIRKHARAKNVRIRGEEIDNFLRFTIEDDGITIKKESIKDSKGNGLKNMRERARAAGGEFTIEPISKRGTRIKLSFPLR